MTPDPKAPEQDQTSDAIDPADVTTTTVSTPEPPDGERVSEAGNAYVGRMMDDDLKTNPRVEGDGMAPESE